MKTIYILPLAAIALGTPALANEPAGFAEAQRTALWNAIQSSPKLVGVDQIVIEGDGTGQTLRGWLMKKNWTSQVPTDLQRPFWARIDRVCADIQPSCFKVVGIWSGSELLAYITE
jgi:hypothetical protein